MMEEFSSILVLVPHPDDEALLAAGLIRRAVTEGKTVSVCLVTNGDYLCSDQTRGKARLGESFAALRSLGVDTKHIYFLGYPDTGYEPEVSFLGMLQREADLNRVFASACSAETYGLVGVIEDYTFLRTGAHAPYNRASLLRDLAALLDETAPELIVTTSEWDQHGDHAALSYFVRDALRRRPGRPVLWEGLVHSPAGDHTWPTSNAPDEPFTMPPNLERDTSLRWANRISVAVPSDCRKYEIIRSYKSALNDDEPEVVAYLLAFAKQDEIFWRIDY